MIVRTIERSREAILTLVFDLREVDGREGRAREVARAAQRAREAARQAREGRGAQVEGGARLHDGARALAAAVRRGHVPRQVRAQLELLRTVRYS